MQRHGQDCQGVWDGSTGTATYRRTPDKETPLWDVHSQVIYWWSADERNQREAFIMVYDGRAWPRPKNANWAYLAFRAVKAPP